MSNSGALFGSTVGAGGGSGGRGGGGGKNLIEFRAGKMTMKGKMVHPDKRKGLLYVHQTDDGLMHFCWKERSKSNPEDDLIIFPEDVEYKVVPQCTTGRVYVLKFKSSNNRKMFFWMQDPKPDKDEENCRKLNDFLNNPPVPGSSRSGAGSGGLSGLPADLAGLSEGSDLQSLLGSMNQQQLMQLLGGMGGMGGLSSLMGGRSSSARSDSNPPSRINSSPGVRTTSSIDANASQTSLVPPRPFTASGVISSTASTTATAQGEEAGARIDATSMEAESAAGTSGPSLQRIQLSDLQNILSGLNAIETEGPRGGVDLTDSLTAELLIPILANPEVQQRLVPFLPEGGGCLPSSEEELRETVHSPQFQQALSGFSAAFSSCQLGPLMAQFGLSDDAVAAATVGDFAAFARALQECDAAKKKAAAAAAASAATEAEKDASSVVKEGDQTTEMEQD